MHVVDLCLERLLQLELFGGIFARLFELLVELFLLLLELLAAG